MIIGCKSATYSLCCECVLRSILKIFFYLISLLLTFLHWDQRLKLWLVVVGEVELNNLGGVWSLALAIIFPFCFLLFEPFLPILLLCLLNYLQLLLVLLVLKFGIFLVYIDVLSFSGKLANNFPQFNSLIRKLLFHNSAGIFVFGNLLLIA